MTDLHGITPARIGEPAFDDRDNPGLWIKRQCETLGISMMQVAKEAKIDRVTIFRWTTGRSEPYWGNFKRVKSVIDGYWDRRKESA